MSTPFLSRLMRTARRDATPFRHHDVSAGAVFRHRPDYGPPEYAEVIDVGSDPVGIRHVRFRLYFGYRDKTVEAGERTLAAVAFARRFAERITRAPTASDDHVTSGNG